MAAAEAQDVAELAPLGVPGGAAVAVAQVAIGETVIPQAFFHLRRIRKPAVAIALPQQRVVNGDLVNTARARH
ncbi:hypothetical protein NVIRENTERO_02877 [Sodalis praecaptivus]|nr:hypothetical protein NVIRENTERO_02877 [Sodalis praecaptivus]